MCLLNKKYFLLDIKVYLLNLIKIYHIVYFQDLLKIQVSLLKNSVYIIGNYYFHKTAKLQYLSTNESKIRNQK